MRHWIAAAAAIIVFASGSSEAAKGARKAPTFADLCQEILGTLQQYDPVTASQMGIHTYDGKLADYSAAAVKQKIRTLKQYESRLASALKQLKTADDSLTGALVKSNVDVALLDLDKIAWYKKSPQLYVDEALNGIYYLTISEQSTDEAKLPSILTRMKAIPALFTTAKQNIRKPPAVWVQSARVTLDAMQEFFRGVGEDLSGEFPKREGEIARAVTGARDAMSDFQTWLASVVTGDDKGFAIGKDAFDYLLRNQYFLSYDADSLLRIGEAQLALAQKAYADYEKVIESQHQTGQDSVFVPASFNRQDILDYYQWEVEQERLYLEANDIVSVPDDIADVTVVETPAFMRPVHAGIAYEPAGPFDSIQQPLFYVRPLPDSMDRQQLEAMYRYVHRRGFKGSVVHEAYPGHHLQMQIAGRNPDPVRKWQMNKMLIEGWALYCEEMMYAAGLYGPDNPQQWLGILGGIRFRAARIIADVKLHTGQFTYDECVDWMTKTLESETEAEEQYVRAEVRRYTYTPTIQMCYLMGKREIELLKEAAMRRDGGNFSEHAFYDKLLAEGSIPPALLWKVLGLTPAEQ
ncbi:hypothetical protein C3F09_08890 [candidate division GN15 bacterium]|uniref:DUF885 domain-containing protein n=1 Tax=candidate division GN15 bacterium TaxID=2072418 RepID=A0A855X527_9BACT|nr:MAG: hypothetical protein C3F09_08890 [candidate division GN15 bacterium]